jgi:uncharacterized integral membrane protein
MDEGHKFMIVIVIIIVIIIIIIIVRSTKFVDSDWSRGVQLER